MIFRRDARAGIRDREHDLGPAFGTGHMTRFNRDGAVIGEFSRIGQEVDQNLAHANGIGAHDGQVVWHDRNELDRFILDQPDGG